MLNAQKYKFICFLFAYSKFCTNFAKGHVVMALLYSN